MKLRFLALLFLIAFYFQFAFGQHDSARYRFKDNLYFSAQLGSGFLIAHRSSLAPLVNSYTQSLFVEIAKSSFGKKAWQQLYNYPSLGIGYYHGSLGNNDIFGHSNGIYGFIEAPYFPEKKVSFTYKFGFGLAYLSKKFDLYDNIYNVAIGSHINYLIVFSFDFKFNLLHNKLFIKTGLGFKHMSNGKTQTPNLGLNIADWHLTAGYYIGERNSHITKSIERRNKQTFMLIVAGGLKEFTTPNLGKYFAGNTTFEYEHAFKTKISFGTGLDIFYDGVVHKELNQKEDNNAFAHAIRYGLHGTYVIYYHKVGFVIQMGTYIAPNYKDDGYIYHRVGFRAKITEHLLANLTMKTHWGRADIVEFGLGYYVSK